jgi:mRNA interferase MazF
MSEAIGIALPYIRAIPIFVPLRKERISHQGGVKLDTIKQGVSRGDIYYADLNPVVGCEQGGIRPVLILQNDIGNRHSPTTIVCAITGKPKKPLPTHTAIADAGRLSRESFALLEQIRTIDRSRLRGWIGRLDEQAMEEINQALSISVGLSPALLL